MQEGGGVSKSQYGVSAEMGSSSAPAMAATSAAAATSVGQAMGMESEQAQLVEAASPISSRPPAASAAMNLDELMPLQGGGAGADEDALAAAAGDGGGVGGGNRWPRQETLELLRIRLEMDAVFRDATLKGPLWEDVSRKLAELGYKRNAKKCREKFENVHKYYKRTKEGRAGRQDGKSYKFFSELEALHSSGAASSTVSGNNASASLVLPPATATVTINPVVSAVSTDIGGMISSPMPISSNIRLPGQVLPGLGMFPPDPSAPVPAPAVVSGSHVIAPAAQPIGVNFSSNSSSSSSGSDEDDDDDEEESLDAAEPSNVGSSRKRKRGSTKAAGGSSSDTRKMMEFFENLMKQVMHKQEVMQQRFLEAIEKREQDRMIREEAWKRQEMARLAREHELMAQDRAISASRDAAIVAFLQKITGQSIQLPTPASNIPAAPPPAVPPSHVPSPKPAPAATQPLQPSQQPPPQQQQQQALQHSHRHTQVVMAIPEQQVLPQEIRISGGGGNFEAGSSRWPKVEVLALIKLRSGLESRYQEAGPKGPLWEEISAGMQRMGYKRNAKRCKEKWENINKYYKKVKESNKKRPEDAKTCPYFHELDALYRNKILGSSSSGGSGNSSFLDQNRPQQQQQQQPENIELDQSVAPEIVPQATLVGTESDNKNGTSTNLQAQASNIALPEGLFGESAPKKPEDIMKELMEEQEQHRQPQQQQQQLILDEYDKIEEADSDNIDQEEDEDEDEDEDLEEEGKMDYKIEFQRQNAGPPNGGGNGAPSFLAVVQ